MLKSYPESISVKAKAKQIIKYLKEWYILNMKFISYW